MSIRTRQVFLSDGLVDQVKKLDVSSSGVLTYLVNSIEKKSDKNQTKLIPYSMMKRRTKHGRIFG